MKVLSSQLNCRTRKKALLPTKASHLKYSPELVTGVDPYLVTYKTRTNDNRKKIKVKQNHNTSKQVKLPWELEQPKHRNSLCTVCVNAVLAWCSFLRNAVYVDIPSLSVCVSWESNL